MSAEGEMFVFTHGTAGDALDGVWLDFKSRRTAFQIDHCVCCCNLYLAVTSLVIVCLLLFFLRKNKNKSGDEPTHN